MKLEWVPLLKIQRDLHGIPRGMDRFREYLRVMIDDSRDDLRLPPLVIMNPMGKERVAELLDRLLGLDAEGVAARAVEEASFRLARVAGEYRVGLVVADDAQGAWTNRYTSELGIFSSGEAIRKRGWLTAVLWSSDSPSVVAAREAALTAVYRAAYVTDHGPPQTLQQFMEQEGWVMAKAGCAGPVLEADDLAYTREIVTPHLSASDQPTLMACLLGDAAARALGYAPQGLSERAGLALALHDVRARLRTSAGSQAGSATGR
jgi:hypothetical protein